MNLPDLLEFEVSINEDKEGLKGTSRGDAITLAVTRVLDLNAEFAASAAFHLRIVRRSNEQIVALYKFEADDLVKISDWDNNHISLAGTKFQLRRIDDGTREHPRSSKFPRRARTRNHPRRSR